MTRTQRALLLPMLLLYWCLGVSVRAGFQDRFAVIFMDAETKQQLGQFPIDRKIVAQGLNCLADLQAKGVVIKFFLDLPQEADSDAALAQAMLRLPTILQARLVSSEPHPNPFPERCFLPELPAYQVQRPSGKSGWIPLPIFSTNALDIGFVDTTGNVATPIVEAYQDKVVRSLLLCCLELSFSAKAQIIPGQSLTLADRSIPLDSANGVPVQYPPRDPLEYLKFHDLLAGRIAPEQIRGKVVILGYDGPEIRVSGPIRPMSAHRFFMSALRDLSDRLDNMDAQKP